MGLTSLVTAAYDRLTDRFAATGSDGETLPLSLTLVSAAIAALVLSPLLWLFLKALAVPPADAMALLTRSSTIEVLLKSVALVAAVTVAATVLGVGLAMLTVRTDLPFRRAWTVLLALPLVIPSYIAAFTYVSAFGPNGLLATVLAPIGVTSLPSIYGFEGATLVLTLYIYPYVFLTTRATLLSLDTTLVEAARTLDNSQFEAFKRVTLPQITPGILAGALLVALYTLSDFGTPTIMHVDVFTRMIYVEYNAFARDSAALLALQLLGVSVLVLALESQIGNTDQSIYVGGDSRTSRGIDLGRWKGPALGLCFAVVSLTLIVPIGVLLLWLTRSSGGFAGQYAFSWGFAWNSLYLAGLTAAISLVLALPVGYLSGRYESRVSTVLDRATYVGYAVPGIVLGLSLVYLGVRYVPQLYQTLPLLVFAYVVRFLPQAVGSTRSSVQQVDRRLTEASRTLGHSSLSTFRRVVLPLVFPGLVSGAALVFLTTMKELPATLLLQPPDVSTLVTYIWLVREAGFYGRAAIPALILVVASAFSMVVILARERYVQH